MRGLNGLAVGESGRIKGLAATGGLKRRLWDLGFTPGAEIACVLAAPGRGMRAYRVRRTVIALRGRDAQSVILEEQSHE